MDKNQHDETVYRVAADTLESLALMFLVPEDESPQPRPRCNTYVAASFTGPFDGVLTLAVSDSILPELAANMLGLEDGHGATPEQQEDALKELANVVCGNLLPAIAGKEPVFHIGAPEVLAAQSYQGAIGSLLPAGEACLLADAGILELTFLVRQPSAVSTC